MSHNAVEGKFYRYKTANHPHTNMAKAALNMMTRTSAQDYRSSNIFMTYAESPLSNGLQICPRIFPRTKAWEWAEQLLNV